MTALATVRMMTRYKAWADATTFKTVMALPEAELLRPRPTRFGNILHTLNHVYVIDDIFRAHLEGRRHGYAARNTEGPPAAVALRRRVEEVGGWYVHYAVRLTEAALDEVVEFEFVDGRVGAMTRGNIILHVVNHGSYHRGFVGDMLYQIPAAFPANDLTVFLQEDARQRPDGAPSCSAISP